MDKHDGVPLTAEEHELVKLWLDRPAGQRSLGDVAELAEWVLGHRPHLLPKGSDDACDYLVRLLADRIEDGDGGSVPQPSGN